MACLADILVLDDEPVITRLLERLLAPEHRVRVAHTPEEALALMAQQPPDVVVSDFGLCGCTSAAFLRAVRTRWPAVMIVLHSGSPSSRWQELLDDGVIDRVVAKPALREELLAAMGG